MKTIITVLVAVYLVGAAPAQAYFHSYGPHSQIVRLNDKVERLTKKASKTSDQYAKAKIEVEIQEALAEIKEFEQEIR